MTRAGLLLCGDLDTAARGVKNESFAIGKASAKKKLEELVLYSISDDYFKLRQNLGLAIGSGQ